MTDHRGIKLNYLRDNRNLEEQNWQLMQVSEVGDKIIERLLSNLKTNLSEHVFISLESLLKIGKKAGTAVEKFLNLHSKSDEYHISLIKKLSEILKDEKVNSNLFKLYHPDFNIRARSFMQLDKKEILNNLPLITPFLTDPDDSVRYALIRALISHNLVNHHNFKHLLEKHCERESNSVIRKEIQENLAIS
ncbi:MAG: HEAT repeat domain-containing protein [Promethearchaeia archaeon]